MIDLSDHVAALVKAWAAGEHKQFHATALQTAAHIARSGGSEKAKKIRDAADRALVSRMYLPPYSGAHTYCTKCEYGSVGLKYTKEDGADFLERECSRCGYVWYEKCADAEKNHG